MRQPDRQAGLEPDPGTLGAASRRLGADPGAAVRTGIGHEFWPVAPASAPGARGAPDRARRAAVAGGRRTGLRQPVGLFRHVQEDVRQFAVGLLCAGRQKVVTSAPLLQAMKSNREFLPV